MSKGEEYIEFLLRSAGIAFEREKTFTDLKQGRFRYDFYIPNLFDGPAIIEYNGEQHYHHIKHFHKTRLEFTRAQGSDRRKIGYCLAHDISLFIIPYWELPKITNAHQLFQQKYRALTTWKNDDDFRTKKKEE